MKRLTALLVAVALLVSGCGLFEKKTQGAEVTHETIPLQGVASSGTPDALASCAQNIKDVAASTASDTKAVVAMMTLDHMCSSAVTAAQQVSAAKLVQAQQPPPQHPWLAAAGAILGPIANTVISLAPVAAQVYNARMNRDTQIAMSGFNRDTQIATVNAFVADGNNIATAATAGYRFIQAPGATYNFSGSGQSVVGSGTATGAVTHTCNGGTAGTGGSGAQGGGTTTGAAGGAGAPGGGANGGTC